MKIRKESILLFGLAVIIILFMFWCFQTEARIFKLKKNIDRHNTMMGKVVMLNNNIVRTYNLSEDEKRIILDLNDNILSTILLSNNNR